MATGVNTTGLVIDTSTLNALRAKANADPKAAIREVAKQFEALFMQEIMKSMRASTLGTGYLDNEGSKLGTEMLDTQLSTKMTGLPGGLSEAIAKQLERQMGLSPGPIPVAPTPWKKATPLGDEGKAARIPDQTAAAFVQRLTPAAKAAEAQTGIQASAMIGQAALETGWGRKEILHADGSPSFNLFGIKAGPDWKGPVAEVTTTEFVNGQSQKITAKFRAYSSYEASFADYSRLMALNPRYKNAVAQGSNAAGFAQGLQQAGYATDPAYADKLTRVINTTLRLQRLGAKEAG